MEGQIEIPIKAFEHQCGRNKHGIEKLLKSSEFKKFYKVDKKKNAIVLESIDLLN